MAGRTAVALVALLVVVAACRSKECASASTAPSAVVLGSDSLPPLTSITPNKLLAIGNPTIVVGTTGGALRATTAQADLFFHGGHFPLAHVVLDSALDPSAPARWPEPLVVYGGPHVNAFIAHLAMELPLAMDATHIRVGGEDYPGDALAVSVIVPAQMNRSAFWLLAGNQTPGVALVNNPFGGDDEIQIADAFGVLARGRWEREGGALRALMQPRAERLEWRVVGRSAKSKSGAAAPLRFMFVSKLPAAANEEAVVTMGTTAVGQVIDKLELEHPGPLTVYVWPDRRSKESRTGIAADGHAVPFARALHIVSSLGLDHLIAHEASHVLMRDGVGDPATALMSEGLAVWTAGGYQGKPLAEWAADKARLTKRPKVTELFETFSKLPAAEAYPLGGLFVQAIVQTVGLKKLGERLIGTTLRTWAADCAAAGTTPEAMEAAFAHALGGT